MKILDQNNMEIIAPNLSLGYLAEEKLFIAHHEAVEAVKEQGHYEVIAVYPNGGKDVEWIIDVPGVEYQEAYDEYEDIFRYILYTAEELRAIEEERNKPTQFDIIEARLAYVEMMTGLMEV